MHRPMLKLERTRPEILGTSLKQHQINQVKKGPTKRPNTVST